MKYWTLSALRTKIERELDLEGEVFMQEPEMNEYINDGIDKAESQIHSLYEDYFLTYSPISLVSGTSRYSLPTTIYANKIRKVIYKNNSDVYEVKRLRDKNKLLNYALNRASSNSNPAYEYLLVNDTAGQPEIIFTPAVNETGSFIEVWHIRNANRLEVDTDICDIPEFIRYVVQYVKVRCYDKEGHPHLGIAQQELAELQQDMVSTLSGMVADDDNEIEADYSSYQEMN